MLQLEVTSREDNAEEQNASPSASYINSEISSEGQCGEDRIHSAFTEAESVNCSPNTTDASYNPPDNVDLLINEEREIDTGEWNTEACVMS